MDFNSPQFARQYHYDGGDLGARLTEKGTEFRLWAPTAQKVQLRLFQSGHEGEAFETLELERITAMVYAPNIPSRRVLEKNRFSLEGTIRRGAVKDGSIYDVCIYGLLRRERAE